LATMMDDSRSCRETSDRGLVARYGQQPEGRCHEIRADCIFAKL